MKKIDKKDQPKLLALVVLAACVLGFGFKQLVATPTTNAATRSAQGVAGDVAGAGAAQTVPGQPVAPVEEVPIQLGGKDPFVPNGPAAPPVPAGLPTPQAKPAPMSVASTNPEIRNLTPLPPNNGGPPSWLGPRPLAPEMPKATGEPTSPAIPPPPPPAYTVTGVVRGDKSIAILRGGAGKDERRFVQPGDPVGNGFKVLAVRADGVEIQSGGRRITLKLGGASRAK